MEVDGWGKRGPYNEREMGSKSFDDHLGRGSELFHRSS